MTAAFAVAVAKASSCYATMCDLCDMSGSMKWSVARNNNLRQALAELVPCAGFTYQHEAFLPGTHLIPADEFVPTFTYRFLAALTRCIHQR